jgi:hypothetical protein
MSRKAGSIVRGFQCRAGYPSKRASSRCRCLLREGPQVKVGGTAPGSGAKPVYPAQTGPGSMGWHAAAPHPGIHLPAPRAGPRPARSIPFAPPTQFIPPVSKKNERQSREFVREHFGRSGKPSAIENSEGITCGNPGLRWPCLRRRPCSERKLKQRSTPIA